MGPQMSPRPLHDASKTAPKTKCVTFFAPAVILIDFRSMFDCLSIDSYVMFNRFSIDLVLIFDKFHVGVLIVV